MPEEPAPDAEGITITRVFDAPRELVFKAWTEPERFVRWFGLGDSEVPLSTIAMDVRPGGAWRATMFAGPDRYQIQWRGVYHEVVEPERLVFTITDQPDGEQEPPTTSRKSPPAAGSLAGWWSAAERATQPRQPPSSRER
jgi:uncharacterized protein YndB with AHSA1/START domain